MCVHVCKYSYFTYMYLTIHDCLKGSLSDKNKFSYTCESAIYSENFSNQKFIDNLAKFNLLSKCVIFTNEVNNKSTGYRTLSSKKTFYRILLELSHFCWNYKYNNEFSALSWYIKKVNILTYKNFLRSFQEEISLTLANTNVLITRPFH